MRAGVAVAAALAVVTGATLTGAAARDDDEGSTSLLAEGAKVVKLADGFAFTEGPAAHPSGDVYFSDIPNDRIHRWTAAGALSTFREQSGGANGLYFDAKGDLIACEGRARRVVAIAPDGSVTVIAKAFGGKKLNSPNDLWISPSGGIWFTDPRYGAQDGLEQGGFHVYWVSPDRRTVKRVIDDLVKPNGIVGTPDGKTLYVADPGAKKTWAYTIGRGGALSDKRLFCESGSDGMTLDERGNLYLTAGAVVVFDPKGTKIETIAVPEAPANVCFGGPDGKTLFITARTSLYSVRMRVRGAGRK